MGIDGESQDGNHKNWVDESGEKAPSRASSLNATAIVLVGLMLLAIATVAVLSRDSGKDSAPNADEIVFEPEEVLLDEGSATLNALYSTANDEFFKADGDDDIGLSIKKNEDTPDLYNVTGTFDSTQKVGVDGMDQGQICTVEILHEVEYSVEGTFSSVLCRFEVSVTMKPSSSQLVAQGCSVDLGLDPSAMFIAPRPDDMVFTRSFESVGSEAFSFYLHDVALPSGVSCPAFSGQ